jgi:hypothetical protein
VKKMHGQDSLGSPIRRPPSQSAVRAPWGAPIKSLDSTEMEERETNKQVCLLFSFSTEVCPLLCVYNDKTSSLSEELFIFLSLILIMA